MAVFKCKMCGGALDITEGQTTAVCEYCGTKQTLPRLDDDRRANLYDRANHFRRGNEFDKAAGIYEQILNEDTTDAEAYWSLVLCRYGIEYVEDPATHKRLPTVNRAQFTSIFDDDNYKSALQYADGYQKSLYEEEAAAINEIQKGILAISQKEEPFDVFICYKETDQNGRRTPDSVLANDLYHQLTQEGFKVFFARITLEDKLGVAYEPYIFAALNSAKVMVVIGTKPEHFNAVWVKNEWSRYLALVKQAGGKKVLIPAYKDMDPYDLPEEFSHLQAQDMSKLGFMQDLIRGVKKLAQADAPQAVVKETVVTGGSDTAPLLKRAFMFLEDGNWSSAAEYCEKVLDMDPESAEAYLGKLMAELGCPRREALKDQPEPFDGSDNYKKVLRFGDPALKQELQGTVDFIKERNETARLTEIYEKAMEIMAEARTDDRYKTAAQRFETIPGFRDADEKAKECWEKAKECWEKAEAARKDAIYDQAMRNMESGFVSVLESAVRSLEAIPGWRDADQKLQTLRGQIERKKAEEAAAKQEEARAQAARTKKIVLAAAAAVVLVITGWLVTTKAIIPVNQYKKAETLLDAGDKPGAAMAFGKSGDYKDAKARSTALWDEIAVRDSISTGWGHTTGLKSNGTVVATGNNEEGQNDVSDWQDIVAVAAGTWHTVGLKSDGTVVAVGYNKDGQCNVSDWRDIVAVSAGGYHTAGLKSDGTVVAVGYNDDGQCDVSGWRDIVAVAAGFNHTVGLKSDGTVVAVGDNHYYQCHVSGWSGIVAIAAGSNYTVGLKSDGTVVAVGIENGNAIRRSVSGWTDIVMVSAESYTMGLKSDGTVVAVESKGYGQCDVSGWRDIVAVAAGECHTVGLKSDGTVVAAGKNDYGQCDVSDWRDIVAVAAGECHTVGLKSDGTVVSVGSNRNGQCDVSDWSDIKLPEK